VIAASLHLCPGDRQVLGQQASTTASRRANDRGVVLGRWRRRHVPDRLSLADHVKQSMRARFAIKERAALRVCSPATSAGPRSIHDVDLRGHDRVGWRSPDNSSRFMLEKPANMATACRPGVGTQPVTGDRHRTS